MGVKFRSAYDLAVCCPRASGRAQGDYLRRKPRPNHPIEQNLYWIYVLLPTFPLSAFSLL